VSTPGSPDAGPRPAVSVVMPFAGSPVEATHALATLAELQILPGDELILADNSGTAPADGRVRVVRADGESSPSYARNVGAEHARGDWVLFLDADCTAPADLIDRYFAQSVADDIGALAGGVVPAPGGAGLAARYGASKSFLDQGAHLAHPYMPRAVAANLLVRRAAFESVGGFYEGVRAAEDTDFSWRIQRAGWRLEARPRAGVQHSYRTSVRALRRQWRGYAAGRAWLGRRYDGFVPQPGLKRAAVRLLRRGSTAPPTASTHTSPSAGPSPGRLARGGFLALDALLGAEELTGFTLSNKPHPGGRAVARVVLVADRFPAQGDPLADFALSLAGARVEATARPEVVARQAARALEIDYREDDGGAARATALLALAARHPLRSARDLVTRGAGAPGLAAIAPAVRRLGHDPSARVHPLGGEDARAVAMRLAALAGRRLEV
jgi:GT2 family glycosyltransferase